MKTMEERRAEARAKIQKAMARFRAEAVSRGITDVETYAAARLAEEFGVEMYDPPEPD